MPPGNQADRASIFYRMVNSVRGEETAEGDSGQGATFGFGQSEGCGPLERILLCRAYNSLPPPLLRLCRNYMLVPNIPSPAVVRHPHLHIFIKVEGDLVRGEGGVPYCRSATSPVLRDPVVRKNHIEVRGHH